MTTPGHLRYDNKTFPLEQATIYGIYEPRGYMSWWIELFPEEGLSEVHYEFNANLKFTGIHIFETTKEDAQKFVDAHLKNEPDIDFEVKFEEVPSGLTAMIVGHLAH